MLSHREILVDVFRNGLAHQFFPKRAGISRVNGSLYTYNDANHYLVLDADILTNMFLRSLENLKRKILADDDFCLQVYDRLKDLHDNYKFANTIDINHESKSSGASTSIPLPSKGDSGVGPDWLQIKQSNSKQAVASIHPKSGRH